MRKAFLSSAGIIQLVVRWGWYEQQDLSSGGIIIHTHTECWIPPPHCKVLRINTRVIKRTTRQPKSSCPFSLWETLGRTGLVGGPPANGKEENWKAGKENSCTLQACYLL